MKIKKGEILEIKHSRSGSWVGIATESFDTEKEEFYPINLYQEESVQGLNTQWDKGDRMPCRKTLCSIKIKGRIR